MELEKVLHMNGGEANTSYSTNSSLQRLVISKAKSIVEEAVIDLYCNTINPHRLCIADLGCSSGPNTLLVVSEIMDVINETCNRLGHPSPEFQVFLNDLPGNDFNTIFRSVPSFCEERGSKFGPACFIAGVPGSFYTRLFPSNSLQFVHSSYSIHFLSQVPEGLVSETREALNKGNIYIAKTSHPNVPKTYLKQFERDFTLFLRLRSQELVAGGRMVLTIMGHEGNGEASGKENYSVYELLGMTLKDMVSEGLIEEDKLDSFNIPYYAPSAEELRNIILTEGSFTLDRFEAFKVNWDASKDEDGNYMILDKFTSGESVKSCIRSVAEPLLVSHFGEAIIDDLFHKFMMKVVEYQGKEKAKYLNLVVSMTRKG